MTTNIELLGEVAIARSEVRTIAEQAGRYENIAVSRESSLAFSLVRALAENLGSVLGRVEEAMREGKADR